MTEEEKLERLEERYDATQKEIKELTKLASEINFTKLNKEESIKWLEKIAEIEKDILMLKQSFRIMEKEIEEININIYSIFKILREIQDESLRHKTTDRIINWILMLITSGIISAIVVAFMKSILK